MVFSQLKRMKSRIAIAASLILIAVVTALFVGTSGTGNPSLAISFLYYHLNYAVVEIRNVGSGTACYYGYGAASPFYEVMIDCGTGWTKAPSRFWCGTGAGSALLPPNQAKTVQVYLPTNQQWKVGVAFRKPGLEDRLPRFVARCLPSAWQSQSPTYTAWSPPIPYSKAQ